MVFCSAARYFAIGSKYKPRLSKFEGDKDDTQARQNSRRRIMSRLRWVDATIVSFIKIVKLRYLLYASTKRCPY